MSAERLKVSYENRSSRFYRQNQEFKKQFCHIYASRLRQLGSELLKEKAQEKFGKLKSVDRVQAANDLRLILF